MANYVNNDELYTLLTAWKIDKVQGNTMDNRFAELLYLICDGILKKPNYNRLSEDVKGEIKSNAILNLILYIHNFNITKSKSKNAAFTYIVFSIETCYKSSLKKIKDKKERLPIVYDSVVVENLDIADIQQQ